MIRIGSKFRGKKPVKRILIGNQLKKVNRVPLRRVSVMDKKIFFGLLLLALVTSPFGEFEIFFVQTRRAKNREKEKF